MRFLWSWCSSLVSVTLVLTLWCSGLVSVTATATAQAEPLSVHETVTLTLPRDAPPADPALKDLEWNRWTSPNNDFVIMSISDSQGKWLFDNLDEIKSWCMARWGLPDASYRRECRVFCVPNKGLLAKLFHLTKSKVEIRPEVLVMWLVLDSPPKQTVTRFLTEISLAEFEAQRGVSLGWWAHRGIALLNQDLRDIKSMIEDVSNLTDENSPVFWSEKLFTITKKRYAAMNTKQQKLFDEESAVVCLLLRREFGEVKFHSFLKLAGQTEGENALQKVYGFQDYGQFDVSLKRYIHDLGADVKANKTPDGYLTITKAK